MATKVEGNVTVTYDGNAITDYCNSADLAAALDKLESTNFGSSAKEYVTGFTEWTISLGGQWSSTLDGYLGPDAVSPPGTQVTTAIAYTEGGTTVTYTWTTSSSIENYTISSATGGLIEWSADLFLSGAPSRSAA